jgi:hypothetical protein
MSRKALHLVSFFKYSYEIIIYFVAKIIISDDIEVEIVVLNGN